MSAKPKHRDAIVQAAMTLFRRRGYAATGLNDIVKLSGAPKGSLYHYFPAGKSAIAEAAVRRAASNVANTLDELAKRHRNAASLLRAFSTMVAGWMARSGFSAGSAIATTLLETTPYDAAMTKAGREAFATWRQAISVRLVADGIPKARAARLAGLVVSTMEGSLIQARVEKSAAIIRSASHELEAHVSAVAAAHARPRQTTGRRARRRAA
jgi:TetR/AcrR family transcriptional regulator, lmrAB and yxaGH operons repressor